LHDHDVDSGYDLLVGNDDIGSTQQHLGARGGRGKICSSGGTTCSELERARQGMERGAGCSTALDGGAALCETGCAVGKTAAASAQCSSKMSEGWGDILGTCRE
jgi:hypothetical protein